MTTAAWVLLIVALALAPVNWWSRVPPGRKHVEYATKPAITLLIAVAALALEPQHPAMRSWFVAGFVLCLAGDVLLMVPRNLFVAGLGAFLLAHLAFAVGFLVPGDPELAPAVLGAVVVVLGWFTVGRPIVAGAAATSASLRLPVLGYLVVISAMVVAGFAHGSTWGVVGALAFFASDALLGFDRFVQPMAAAPVGVMATYHLALVGLLLALP